MVGADDAALQVQREPVARADSRRLGDRKRARVGRSRGRAGVLVDRRAPDPERNFDELRVDSREQVRGGGRDRSALGLRRGRRHAVRADCRRPIVRRGARDAEWSYLGAQDEGEVEAIGDGGRAQDSDPERPDRDEGARLQRQLPDMGAARGSHEARALSRDLGGSGGFSAWRDVTLGRRGDGRRRRNRLRFDAQGTSVDMGNLDPYPPVAKKECGGFSVDLHRAVAVGRGPIGKVDLNHPGGTTSDEELGPGSQGCASLAAEIHDRGRAAGDDLHAAADERVFGLGGPFGSVLSVRLTTHAGCRHPKQGNGEGSLHGLTRRRRDTPSAHAPRTMPRKLLWPGGGEVDIEHERPPPSMLPPVAAGGGGTDASASSPSLASSGLTGSASFASTGGAVVASAGPASVASVPPSPASATAASLASAGLAKTSGPASLASTGAASKPASLGVVASPASTALASSSAPSGPASTGAPTQVADTGLQTGVGVAQLASLAHASHVPERVPVATQVVDRQARVATVTTQLPPGTGCPLATFG